MLSNSLSVSSQSLLYLMGVEKGLLQEVSEHIYREVCRVKFKVSGASRKAYQVWGEGMGTNFLRPYYVTCFSTNADL